MRTDGTPIGTSGLVRDFDPTVGVTQGAAFASGQSGSGDTSEYASRHDGEVVIRQNAEATGTAGTVLPTAAVEQDPERVTVNTQATVASQRTQSQAQIDIQAVTTTAEQTADRNAQEDADAVLTH